MMRLKHWRSSLALTLAVAFSAASGTFLLPQALADGAATAQVAQADLAADLPHLANSGRFSEVLSLLKTGNLPADQPAVHSLIEDLERYQANEQQRNEKRKAAYEEALDKAQQAIDNDKLEDALVAAIDAHGLAVDKADVLANPLVKQLVQQGERAAIQAEQDNDWVHALSLYRLLDLLYDDYATYHDHVKQAGRHVRVLQLYAPKRLETLYRAQMARREKKEDEKQPDPFDIERESWETRLKDVDLAMLRQTLHQAARQHINAKGYRPLMQGAVDSLLVMLRTKGLEETFPAFANQQRVTEFRQYVERISASLKAPGPNPGFLEAATTIDKILLKNDQTLGLPESVLVYELTEGATQTLDEFSAVIWPQEKEQFSRSTRGKFYGIGIQISRRDGRLIVVSPLANTPAQRAGLEAGDIIAKVEGRDTSTWSLDKAVREITGPEGTVVTLGIERAGTPDLTEYQIKRAEIVIESIRGWKHTDAGDWNYLIDPDNRIGYVRLSQFIPQTADDLDAAINQMEADGPINGLILDLRFNPGGLLSSAIDVVDRFIPQGPIVFTVDADGKRNNESRAKQHHTYRPFPVVVLVNQGSASASEIVSGALQDYSRALVVGTRSFGKGSVQDLFPLDRGKAYLKLTTQYYMLPLGRIIHRQPEAKQWGIEPDLVIDMTAQQVADSLELRQEVDILRDAHGQGDEQTPVAEDILSRGLDAQLETALLVLNTRLAAQHIALAQPAEVTTAKKP